MSVTVFVSCRNLRQWVDDQTSDWLNRTAADVDNIVNAIMADPRRPHWDTDWAEYLDTLDLTALAESEPRHDWFTTSSPWTPDEHGGYDQPR